MGTEPGGFNPQPNSIVENTPEKKKKAFLLGVLFKLEEYVPLVTGSDVPQSLLDALEKEIEKIKEYPNTRLPSNFSPEQIKTEMEVEIKNLTRKDKNFVRTINILWNEVFSRIFGRPIVLEEGSKREKLTPVEVLAHSVVNDIMLLDVNDMTPKGIEGVFKSHIDAIILLALAVEQGSMVKTSSSALFIDSFMEAVEKELDGNINKSNRIRHHLPTIKELLSNALISSNIR